jgi:hypothetical protein
LQGIFAAIYTYIFIYYFPIFNLNLWKLKNKFNKN